MYGKRAGAYKATNEHMKAASKYASYSIELKADASRFIVPHFPKDMRQISDCFPEAPILAKCVVHNKGLLPQVPQHTSKRLSAAQKVWGLAMGVSGVSSWSFANPANPPLLTLKKKVRGLADRLQGG